MYPQYSGVASFPLSRSGSTVFFNVWISPYSNGRDPKHLHSSEEGKLGALQGFREMLPVSVQQHRTYSPESHDGVWSQGQRSEIGAGRLSVRTFESLLQVISTTPSVGYHFVGFDLS